jgi:hypothetical protein
MRCTVLSLCLIIATALASVPAAAQEPAKDAAKAAPKGVTAWKESLELAADGSVKVGLDLTLSNWDSDAIDLPLSYAKPEGITVASSDVAATAQAGKAGDMRVLKLTFDRKPPAATKLGVSFAMKNFLDMKKARSPRGFYSFSYTFANLSSTNVGAYSLKVLLPEGYKMKQVNSSTPKATGNEVTPPYDFSADDGRTMVNLRAPSVAVGKNAAIAFDFQPERKSGLAVVAISILLAAIAMYVKRDVLTKENYEPQTGA